MKRSLALGLGAAALMAVAGCSSNGSYRLRWDFLVDPATGATESSTSACGKFYVDSVLANGTSTSGDAEQVVALCTPGWVSASAPPGTWTFTVSMLSSQGAVIQTSMSSQTTAALPISTDTPPTEFSVTLVPR
jgi:hypothetical protein